MCKYKMDCDGEPSEFKVEEEVTGVRTVYYEVVETCTITEGLYIMECEKCHSREVYLDLLR